MKRKWIIAYLAFHLLCAYMAEGSWYAMFAHGNKGYPEIAERDRRSDAWSGLPMALLTGPLCLPIWGMEDGLFEHGIVWNWPVAPRLKDVEYAVEEGK